MFKIMRSKFIGLLLAGAIISASAPSTEIVAFGFFSKNLKSIATRIGNLDKKTVGIFALGATVFVLLACSAVFGWKKWQANKKLDELEKDRLEAEKITKCLLSAKLGATKILSEVQGDLDKYNENKKLIESFNREDFKLNSDRKIENKMLESDAMVQKSVEDKKANFEQKKLEAEKKRVEEENNSEGSESRVLFCDIKRFDNALNKVIEEKLAEEEKKLKEEEKKFEEEKKIERNKNKKVRCTFDDWKKECDVLPTYTPSNYFNKTSILTKDEFIDTIVEFASELKDEFLNKDNWFEQKSAFTEEDFNVDKDKKRKDAENKDIQDKFFVQKLHLPKGAQVFMHADIHGDKTVMEYLGKLRKDGIIGNDFEIKDKNNYIAFLGDYTDRGNYGAEVLYTLARLKIANHENCILLRGNHEDIGANVGYGFIGDDSELFNKFGGSGLKEGDPDWRYLLNKLYNLLPSAVFACILPEDEKIVKKYSILCHAGIEPRFDPKPLLKTTDSCLFQAMDVDVKKWAFFDNELKARLGNVYSGENNQRVNFLDVNGFLWNEFFDEDGYNLSDVNKPNCGGRGGLIVGDDITNLYFNKCSSESDGFIVNRMFKAHQHDGKVLSRMVEHGGIYNFGTGENFQWNKQDKHIELDINHKPIWILNVGSDSEYGKRANNNKGFKFDHYSVLKKSEKIKDGLCIEPHMIQVLDESNKLIIN